MPTVLDSSGNNRHGTYLGSAFALPTIVASPWSGFSNALSFDGVNRFQASQCFNCGTTSGLTVSGTGAAAAFCLEGKFKTGATVGVYIIVGRWNGAVGGGQPVLYIQSDAGTYHFHCALRNSAGTTVDLVGTTTVAANTAYDVSSSYDGTTWRLLVNGVIEASAALAGIEAPDTTTRFLIGRDEDPGVATNGGYPFLGTIEEVRLSNTARYTGNYTPATTPFTADANTLGLWHLDALVPDPVALTSGITAYWKLDEASGANRLDSVGSETLTPLVAGQATGKVGNAASFTGAGCLWRLSDATLQCGAISFTWAGWAYFTTVAGEQWVLGKEDGITGYREYILRMGGLAASKVDGGITAADTLNYNCSATTFGALSINTWYFVVFRYEASTNMLTIGVNNTYDSLFNCPAPITNTDSFNIGAEQNDGYHGMSGRADEVGFWKRALTANELTLLYNEGLSNRSYPWPRRQSTLPLLAVG